MLHIEKENRVDIFVPSPLLRNGEDTVVLLFRCPVFFSSFIQSCKAAVWCHQSQSVCTSCAALIGCNDLRMSLRTLMCFSLWPICFPVLPRAGGCLPRTRRRDPPTLQSLRTTPQQSCGIIIHPLRLFRLIVTYGYHLQLGGWQNICVRMFVKKVFLASFFFFLELLIKAPHLVQKKDSPVLCANNEVTLPSENKLLMILFSFSLY